MCERVSPLRKCEGNSTVSYSLSVLRECPRRNAFVVVCRPLARECEPNRTLLKPLSRQITALSSRMSSIWRVNHTLICRPHHHTILHPLCVRARALVCVCVWEVCGRTDRESFWVLSSRRQYNVTPHIHTQTHSHAGTELWWSPVGWDFDAKTEEGYKMVTESLVSKDVEESLCVTHSQGSIGGTRRNRSTGMCVHKTGEVGCWPTGLDKMPRVTRIDTNVKGLRPKV